MPWRGPEYPGEFPSLGWVVAQWIEELCVIPDRVTAGEPFRLSDEQLEHLVWQFRLRPDAVFNVDRPSAPFVYTGSLLVRSQKWGKGPFSAARICAQAKGPALFAGWDASGEPVGMPWATPHIQVAAVAEDQTENIWRVLRPMIELGPLADLIPDTGLDRINLSGGGLIERVTSKGTTRLGARITYAEFDEPHLMTERNGGHLLADTMRRNIAGMGGRWSATGNAYDPGENSVEQIDVENPQPDVFVDFPESLPGWWGNKVERRRILRHAYRGAPWVDVDRVEAECNRLAAKGKASEAERFYGNRVVAGASAAFDPLVWRSLIAPPAAGLQTIARMVRERDPEQEGRERLVELEVGGEPLAGRRITLGFDGARRRDSTGLIGTDLERGHQFIIGAWERPRDLPDDYPWEIDEGEVDVQVERAFSTWEVVRGYFDPPYWETAVDRWAGRYGDQRVIQWPTYINKRMAFALKAWRNDWRPGGLTHDGHPLMTEHVGNAVKRLTNIRDEPDGEAEVDSPRGPAELLWVIRKESAHSARKIDLCMAACLSWEARGDAIRAGALAEDDFEVAAW